MDDFLRWNGNVISAKSCAFSLAGVPYIGIVALDYEDQLDAELVHGANKDGAPIGYTSGEYSVSSFNFSVLKDVWIAKMQNQLAALSAAAGSPGSLRRRALAVHGAVPGRPARRHRHPHGRPGRRDEGRLPAGHRKARRRGQVHGAHAPAQRPVPL